jgi:hypothetical protein
MGYTDATKALGNDAMLGTPVWVSMHSASPSSNGANEITTNGCARVQVEFGAAAGTNGAKANSNVERFGPATPGAMTQATHWGYWTLETGGTFRGGFALTTPRTAGIGDYLEFAVGALVATITDPT